jgi:hypothetical protein
MNPEADWKLTAAALHVHLDRDPRPRLRAPNAGVPTTRHDTCAQFCWVTARHARSPSAVSRVQHVR